MKRTKKMVKRILAVIPAVALQILWLIGLIRWLSGYAAIIQTVLSLLAVVLILFIFTKEDEGTYKMLWLLVILSLPILGTVLYLFFGNKRTAKPLRRQLDKTPLPEHIASSQAERISDERVRQTFSYVEKMSGFPTITGESMEFFPSGEAALPSILNALQHAENYIYLEYFIVESGFFWDSIAEVLCQKAANGVDVRVLYDDIGSIQTFSKEETRLLEEKGIHCAAFNEMHLLTGTLNYRDHRKLLIIDGTCAFSGGINLADEYVNHISRYGYWKDLCFCVKGKPAWIYTQMFLQFWNAFTKEPISQTIPSFSECQQNGFILSYYDSPIQSSNVSYELYIELLNQAQHTAYFYTPYLMLGDSLLEAFQRAARRGVDVRLYTPAICDGKIVGRMGRAFYAPLLANGVKIFEYTPGFIHAKACLIDGEIGTIGTVNLDYRSLFLHFENNSLMYKTSLLDCLAQDMADTESQSEQIMASKNPHRHFTGWFVDGVLRIFAPLC